MKHVHFIGIAGSAMGSVAVALSQAGYTVTGSDEGVYPPMSTVLTDAGITWYQGFHPDRLRDLAPDVTVVGNAISRGNPELELVLNDRMPMTSMAELVGSELIDRNTSIVCTGTHGKTTTSSMAAWMLHHAGRQPGFLIGGVPRGFSSGCRPVPPHVHNTRAGVFVSEGDEYDTAFFDKRSKFVHYRPTIAIINNIEFDHADIFDTIDDIVWSFQQMVRRIPSNGALLVNADDPTARRAALNAPAPVHTVGFSDDATYRIDNVTLEADVSMWTLLHHGKPYATCTLPMAGEHNIRNASMAVIACTMANVTIEEAVLALREYAPPKRRLEEIALWHGCTVIDDFAHHPTAIRATVQALRQRYADARLHVVFEPRSNTTTRAFFQRELEQCFDGANTVVVGPVNRPERYAEHDRLNTEQIVAALSQQSIQAMAIPAERATDPGWGADVLPWLRDVVAEGDVIAILSNGNVGGLRTLLAEADTPIAES